MLLLPLIRGDPYPCMDSSFQGSNWLDSFSRTPFHPWILVLPILHKEIWTIQPYCMEQKPRFLLHLNRCHTHNPLPCEKNHLLNKPIKLGLAWSNMIRKISKEKIIITIPQISTSEIEEETIVGRIMSHHNTNQIGTSLQQPLLNTSKGETTLDLHKIWIFRPTNHVPYVENVAIIFTFSHTLKSLSILGRNYHIIMHQTLLGTLLTMHLPLILHQLCFKNPFHIKGQFWTNKKPNPILKHVIYPMRLSSWMSLISCNKLILVNTRMPHHLFMNHDQLIAHLCKYQD